MEICTKPASRVDAKRGTIFWQDKLHVARHQSPRDDQNFCAQIKWQSARNSCDGD